MDLAIPIILLASKQASKQASSVATCNKDIFDASVDMGEYYANRRFFYVTFLNLNRQSL